MDLPGRVLEALRDRLSEATALVLVDDKPIGSAFFVSDELLLTCAHVAVHQMVEIHPVGRPRRPAEVVDSVGGTTDLALLRSHPLPGELPTCVVLDKVLLPGPCVVAGFPREDGAVEGQEVYDVRVHARRDLAGGDQILEVESGRPITWGMSGGPVLSARSGAVIGIVRSSKAPRGDRGGGAIPISRAVEAFAPIRGLMPPRSSTDMTRWRDALGRDAWQKLARSWSTEDHVDLWVSGKRNHWVVRMEQVAGPQVDRRGPDLGEEVAEAIFHWARGQHIHGPLEVALLGRLLASALFPQNLADHLRSRSKADCVSVRLHIEPGSELTEIPWEVAAVPREHGRFLAADDQYRFVRVVDDPDRPVVSPSAKPVSQFRVLAVVAQPTTWRYFDVHRPSGGIPYEWPQSTTIRSRLRECVERSKVSLKLFDTAQHSDVIDELKRAARAGRPYDVLHYIGTGKLEAGDGQARKQLVFVDDDDGPSWDDATTVLNTAAATGVRLVVLELMLPPGDQEFQPLTHRTLCDVVGGSVSAMVLTNHLVHPLQLQKFNRTFYEVLASGESIETAVQSARYKVMNDKPLGDAAGFGWFTVVTGPQADIRLVRPQPDDATEGGALHPTTPDGGSTSTLTDTWRSADDDDAY